MMLSEAAKHMRGRLVGKDINFDSVTIDTRTLQEGDIYLALKGERFDGHDFIGKAVEQGACACIVKDGSDCQELDRSVIYVEDTRLALGQLSLAWRQQFNLVCIAITGSSGKTTVKEMIASILALDGQTLATKGNLNNDIGVPLTLLRLKETDKYAVIELGASALGEIDYTTRLVKPNVALITNIAEAHIEGFGSIDAVSRAKSEIFDGLSENGIAIVNMDEPYSKSWEPKLENKKVLRVSRAFRDNADMWLDDIETMDNGSTQFQIKTPDSIMEVKLKLLGEHNAHNALLAAAAAKSVGVNNKIIAQGLESLNPVPGRLFPEKGFKDIKIIDDTYNANPLSVKSAITLLSRCGDNTTAVLGDMAELGEDSESMHEAVGAWAAQNKIHQLISIGQFAKNTASGYGPTAITFDCQEEAITELKNILDEGSTVLVKGSRSAHMENIVNALKEEEK